MKAVARTILSLLLAAPVAAPLASPLAAQRQLVDPDATTPLSGVVVDRLQGEPLPGAIVLLADEQRGLLTDSLGRFRFENVPLGPQLLAVKQYGYDEINLDLDLTDDHEPLRVELEPRAIALDGFTVIADNLATMERELTNRRNAYGSSARALPQSRLASSNARNVMDFLQREGGLYLHRCGTYGRGPATTFQATGRGPSGGACVLRRGSSVRPRVYIDEAFITGGLQFLAMFQPYELYLVEVFSGGLEIRAYTHWYMERLAERPRKLWPIGL